MNKAYGYLRVSGKSQVDGYGFDRQEEAIKNYADKAGYEIVSIFKEEAVSGTTEEANRPAFQAMVAEILKDGIKVVMIEGLDRLAREYRIQETLLIYLASKGITLISARTEEDVTQAIESDPMKKALVQIQGIFAELEKSLLVKKLRNAREKAKAEKGKCEGRKGYAEKAPHILEAVRRLRRKPKGERRLTLGAIADRLNTAGYRTRMGKPFDGMVVANLLRAKKQSSKARASQP